MKTILDDIIEKVFKIDGEGRTVFFPLGFFGIEKTGYILSTEGKKDEIKKIYRYYSNVLFSIYMFYFLLLFVFNRSVIILISSVVLFSIHFIWLHSKIKKVVEGLQISDLVIPPEDKRDAWTAGLIAFILIFVMPLSLLVFLVFGVLMAGVKGALISISSIFLVFTVLITAVYVLSTKIRKNRNPK